MNKAQEDIQEGLYLCEKYQLESERDTACRRMGRVLHDLAIYELKRNKKKDARGYLEQAHVYFEEGLKYARHTNDVLEELSNLAELAFIVDDFMNVVGSKRLPQKYQNLLDVFKRTLDSHRKDRFRIYQFSVFENLYKLEKAAIDYQDGNYKRALNGYLEAYVGLASDPGYGLTRFKQYFPHLINRIEELPAKDAEVWCKAFIKAWEETPIQGKDGRTLAQEVHRPDLVVWCRQYLQKTESE
jgi:tetratricopeptide (TPR) repeat protein